MGERPTNAIPILIAGLCAEHAGDRRTVALRLGHFGKAAAEAVPVLLQLLEDQDEAVRSAAKRALKEIDPTVLDEHTAAP
jgi:HEAT repeat protein